MLDPKIVLSKWRVWTHGDKHIIAHAIDGDEPTIEEWQEIGEALINLNA